MRFSGPPADFGSPLPRRTHPDPVSGPTRRPAIGGKRSSRTNGAVSHMALRVAHGLFRLWLVLSVLWIGGGGVVAWRGGVLRSGPRNPTQINPPTTIPP